MVIFLPFHVTQKNDHHATMLITTSLCHMFCWCSRIMRLINNFFQVAAACALVMFGGHWVSGRRPGCSSTQKVSVTEVPADLHLLAFLFTREVRTLWPANNICTCLRPLQSSKSRALFGVSHFPFQKHSCHRAPAKLKVCFSWQQTGTDTLQQLIAGTEMLALSLEKRNRSRTQTHRRCKVLRPTGVTSVSAFAATLFPFGKTAAVVCLNTYYMSGITRCCVGGGFLFFSSPSSTLMKREHTKTNQGFKYWHFYNLCHLRPRKPHSSEALEMKEIQLLIGHNVSQCGSLVLGTLRTAPTLWPGWKEKKK